MPASVQAVFFDLDGTLADTAPDLAGALNRVRAEDGKPAVPLEELRPYTSQGVRGLIGAAYGWTSDHADYPAIADRMLAHYAANICEQSRLFSGVPELLDALEERRLAWGIVTNKHARFTQPLVRALALDVRARSIVSGDTAALPKPAPDPLLHAARESGVAPTASLYIGDDPRDVEAARAAGMRSLAVTWGYHGAGLPPEEWGADGVVHHPREVLDWLVSD
ncbi:MAG: HAD-IA family hydrolase [Moraxellaceae bacterium]|nr:HAD-IA family hydrolase [Moraxellaceae bacterium]